MFSEHCLLCSLIVARCLFTTSRQFDGFLPPVIWCYSSHLTSQFGLERWELYSKSSGQQLAPCLCVKLLSRVRHHHVPKGVSLGVMSPHMARPCVRCPSFYTLCHGHCCSPFPLLSLFCAAAQRIAQEIVFPLLPLVLAHTQVKGRCPGSKAG